MDINQFNKSTYRVVQCIRAAIKEDVCALLARNVFTKQQWNVAAGVINDALEKGYATAQPMLLRLCQQAEPAVDNTTLPDALIDVGAAMVAQPKRNFCVYTVVRDDPFLSLWCDYYGKAFGDDNLYVLDNSTTDNTVQRAKLVHPLINVVSVPSNDVANFQRHTNTIKLFQKVFFRGYRVVVHTDADEFLIPDTGDLKVYCDQFLASDDKYVRATGWNVVHQIDSEPALTVPLRDVLNNRNFAVRRPDYDKTQISKVVLDWVLGQHNFSENNKMATNVADPTLSLVHLRNVDFDLLWQQIVRRNSAGPTAGEYFKGDATVEQLQVWMRGPHPYLTPQHESVVQSRTVPDVWRQAFR